MTPQPDPVATATEYLRRLLAIAAKEGWQLQARCIQRTIDRIESSVF